MKKQEKETIKFILDEYIALLHNELAYLSEGKEVFEFDLDTAIKMKDKLLKLL